MRYRTPVVAGAIALLTVLAGTSIAVGADTAPPTPTAHRAAQPVAAALPADRTYTVTLITGDVVTLRTHASGCPDITVRPAHQDEVLSKSCDPNGHVRVLPASATKFLGDVLDPALFDVTGLIQQGYDDQHSQTLPVIVQYAHGKASSAFSSKLGQRRALPSVHGVAGRESKAETATLSRLLPGLGTAAASSGVGHVWLDRRVHASAVPDTPAGPVASAPVYGAASVSQAGYTGKGVRVAVLDTGVDASHPDLVGKVVASANFTGDGEDTTDHFGHGTHVAATIAGTGAASGGRYRGVAPDAQLVVGKVLGDDGYGTDSAVIAGMQWAAPLASVVNMSLGDDTPSDGTDPTSEALDALTAEYGTLFVVAAGNDGPTPGTIGSPAAAAAALTVGAVDSTGAVAAFSGQGPVTGSRALKPEIVAPGVDIISARAAGTDLGTVINSNYTELSGTSMATPQVSGAAALVVQEHPQWTAGRLKDAITGAADAATGADIYGQGAGRLDVTKALAGPIGDQAALELGTMTYPQSGTDSAAMSWTNVTATSTALHLSVELTDRFGAGVPAGTAALSTTNVSIAPGGTGSTVLTVDPTKLANRPGYYEGMLTATATGVVVRTPVVFYVEPASYDLTVSATPLPDTPSDAMYADAMVVNLDDPAIFAQYVDVDSTDTTTTVRVPAGRYSVVGDVFDDSSLYRSALAGSAEVAVDRDSAVTLNGAGAHPVTAAVTGVATQAQEAAVEVIQTSRNGMSWTDEEYSSGQAAADGRVYAAPIAGVDVGSLRVYEAFGLRAPGTAPSLFLYDLLETLPGSVPADPHYQVGVAERARLARIDQQFNQLDVPGAVTAHQRYGATPDGWLIAQDISDSVPANRVDYVTPGVQWSDEAYVGGDSDVDSDLLFLEASKTYAPGSRQQKAWFGQPLHTDWYDDPGPSGSFCTPRPTGRTSGNLHVDLVALADRHERINCLSLFWPGTPPTLALYRNGQRIDTATGFTADFGIPQAAASYQLVEDQDGIGIPLSTHVHTAWTFRSTGRSDDSSAPVPLLSIDYALPLDAMNHPTGTVGTFAIRQSIGVPAQRITAFNVWTSIDDGVTWSVAATSQAGGGFTAQLPVPSAGQAVSLRVSAAGDGGSAIDQTIIRAYHAEGDGQS